MSVDVLTPLLAHLRQIVLIADLAGTFVFAISGALLGVQRRLDIFGVLVLAFAASSAGGIARDVLIGAVPPAAVADWRYLAVAGAAGVAVFLWHAPFAERRDAIAIFDAAGLALFSVAGAHKALAFGINPVSAAVLGMVTGIGGGIVRDLLVVRTPAVLRGELYAVAALAGAGLVVIGQWLGWPLVPTALAAGFACFVLRLAAIRRRWNLPVARSAASPETSDD